MTPSNDPLIIVCYHCGNRTPHRQLNMHVGRVVYEHIGDDKYEKPFVFFSLACGTCEGLSVFGGFENDAFSGPSSESPNPLSFRRLYPRGPDVQPPEHTVTPSSPIPEPVRRAYDDAWPLRHINPTAFANQIRRALEFVCKDRGATGRTLAEQLRDLSRRAVFPAELADTGDLLRQLGNIGSHASDHRIDMWDAELADELFRMILQYVYLVPAHVTRMKERLSVRSLV
jgi:hypothetical protein